MQPVIVQVPQAGDHVRKATWEPYLRGGVLCTWRLLAVVLGNNCKGLSRAREHHQARHVTAPRSGPEVAEVNPHTSLNPSCARARGLLSRTPTHPVASKQQKKQLQSLLKRQSLSRQFWHLLTSSSFAHRLAHFCPTAIGGCRSRTFARC